MKNTNETKRMIDLLKTGSVELRCFDKMSPVAVKMSKQVIWSGVFDSTVKLIDSVKYAMKMKMDIYNTINPTNVKVTNDLKPFRLTTKDSDIEFRSEIFFDFDPVRETGKAANEYEVQSAILRAEVVAEFLHQESWSTPSVGYSGNGAHLYYKTKLPTDILLNGLYEGLSMRFSDDEVALDVVVRNLGRIARCLGTFNSKAGRKSTCESIGDFTDPDIILKTIDKLTPPKPKKHYVKPNNKAQQQGSYIKGLDVVGLFSSSGMYVSATPHIGKHWVRCINEAAHGNTGNTDTCVWTGDNPQYHCSHDHCSHLNILDVIKFFGVTK